MTWTTSRKETLESKILLALHVAAIYLEIVVDTTSGHAEQCHEALEVGVLGPLDRLPRREDVTTLPHPTAFDVTDRVSDFHASPFHKEDSPVFNSSRLHIREQPCKVSTREGQPGQLRTDFADHLREMLCLGGRIKQLLKHHG